MYRYPVCENEITKIIAKLTNNKSPGPENITHMLLKNTENEIIDPLLHICNFSFSTGTVQKTLQMATITPM